MEELLPNSCGGAYHIKRTFSSIIKNDSKIVSSKMWLIVNPFQSTSKILSKIQKKLMYDSIQYLYLTLTIHIQT